MPKRTIQDQLQNLDLDNIKATEIKTALGKSFLNADDTLMDGNRVTTAWRSVHAPTYGAVIPRTIKVEGVSLTGADTTLNTPAEQQVNSLIGVSAANTGLTDPVIYDINLTDGVTVVPIIQGESVPAGGDVTATMPNLPIYWDKDTYLQATVTSGTATDVVISLAYYSPVQ